jgi:hypothetical protein
MASTRYAATGPPNQLQSTGEPRGCSVFPHKQRAQACRLTADVCPIDDCVVEHADVATDSLSEGADMRRRNAPTIQAIHAGLRIALTRRLVMTIQAGDQPSTRLV